MSEQFPSKDLLRGAVETALQIFQAMRYGERPRYDVLEATEIMEAALQAPAPEPAPMHDDDHLSRFSAWLVKEMPAGTVIGDPQWWARKLLAAACVTAPEDPRAGQPPSPSPKFQVGDEVWRAKGVWRGVVESIDTETRYRIRIREALISWPESELEHAPTKGVPT